MSEKLNSKTMLQGLAELDAIIPREVTLIVGGGSAMMLAHHFPLSTFDIDAVPKGMSSEELSPYIEDIAQRLGWPGDWLNPWYASFTHVLPADYATRLIPIYHGKRLKALALGADDLLLMKCYAHRSKDIAHARALLRAGADADKVAAQILELKHKQIPSSQEALDFLDEILDLESS